MIVGDPPLSTTDTLSTTCTPHVSPQFGQIFHRDNGQLQRFSIPMQATTSSIPLQQKNLFKGRVHRCPSPCIESICRCPYLTSSFHSLIPSRRKEATVRYFCNSHNSLTSSRNGESDERKNQTRASIPHPDFLRGLLVCLHNSSKY